ncbi:MAG TPA: glycosyltransferase family 2 protein [Cyclobacteriaceae bacterium]|jgi:GT2 family glycosyltransferase|nr:glycosyltransferase family 2 protein [Cyclobacteriaceae bacterium]
MICIVIPVHNRKEFTRSCIESLLHQTLRVDYIIVVDDGSTDGTDEMLQEYSEIIVLHGDGSLFWTASVNMGIKLALHMDADYVMTLNNDTIATPDFIEKMMKSAEQNPLAILGALDVDIKTKEPYYGGEIFDWRSGESKFLLKTLRKEDRKGLHEVSLFPGRGLLIPKIVFKTIGLFAEKQLPHYMADYDFTLLARRNGFPIFCNYDAVLYTYPEEGGDHKLRAKKTLKNYFKHLFNIRGGGNLRNFTVYALRNCPQKDIAHALFSGYLRRVGGFWLN